MAGSEQKAEISCALVDIRDVYSFIPPQPNLFEKIAGKHRSVKAGKGKKLVLLRLSAKNVGRGVVENVVDEKTPVLASSQFVLVDGLGEKYEPIVFFGDDSLGKNMVGVPVVAGSGVEIEVLFEVPDEGKCLRHIEMNFVGLNAPKKVLRSWSWTLKKK